MKNLLLVSLLLSLCGTLSATQLSDGVIDFEGAYSIEIDGSRVTFTIDKIVNYSPTLTSGPLRIELWASSIPFNGVNLTGTRTALFQTLQVGGLSDKLPPNSSFDNIVFTTNYTVPSPSSIFNTIVLSMFSPTCTEPNNFCPIAYVPLNGNSGGIANSIDQEPYQSIHGFTVLPFGDGLFSGSSETASTNGSLNSADYTTPDGFHMDVYEFTLDHASNTNVTMTSNQFGTFIYLVRIDAGQQPLFLQTVKGVTNQSIFEEVLQPGTYWVGTTSTFAGDTGSYTLEVTTSSTGSIHTFDKTQTIYGLPVTVNPNPQIFGALSDDDSRLSDGSYIDIYQLNFGSTTQLQLNLESLTFDTYLIFANVLPDQTLDPNLQFQNDDFGGTQNSQIIATVPAGTYWIAVSSFEPNVVGNYALRIRVIP